MDSAIQEQLQKVVRGFAVKLDLKVPKLAFSDSGWKDHQFIGYRRGVLFIAPQAIERLNFDQLRTVIAYQMAIRAYAYRDTKMGRFTKYMVFVVILTIALLVIVKVLPNKAVLLSSAIFSLMLLFGTNTNRIIERVDRAVLKLVGDIELMKSFLSTQGFRSVVFGVHVSQVSTDRLDKLEKLT